MCFSISFDYRRVSYFAHTAASQLPGKNLRLIGWVLFGTYIVILMINLVTSETSEQFLNDNLAMALCLLIPALFCWSLPTS